MIIGKNTTVKIDYALHDGEGNLLENTEGSGGVTYLHGGGFLLPALEAALIGRSEGDEIRVALTVAEAFGERDETLVFQIPRGDFENPESVQLGEWVKVHDGEPGGIAMVAALADEMITLNGNHPLAGKELVFSLTIRKVRETSQEDLHTLGRQHRCHDSPVANDSHPCHQGEDHATENDSCEGCHCGAKNHFPSPGGPTLQGFQGENKGPGD